MSNTCLLFFTAPHRRTFLPQVHGAALAPRCIESICPSIQVKKTQRKNMHAAVRADMPPAKKSQACFQRGCCTLTTTLFASSHS